MPTPWAVEFKARIGEVVFVVVWTRKTRTCDLCNNGITYGYVEHGERRDTSVALLGTGERIPCPRCHGDGIQYYYKWEVTSGKLVKVSYHIGRGDSEDGKQQYYVDTHAGDRGRFCAHNQIFVTEVEAKAALPEIRRKREKKHPLNPA